MKTLTAYCYALSGAAFAIFVTWADNTNFWASRSWTSVILAVAIPTNLAAGWLCAHRPVDVPGFFYRCYCIAAIGLGLCGLALFMFSINNEIGGAFLLGLVFSLQMVDGLFDPHPQSFKKRNKDQQDKSQVD